MKLFFRYFGYELKRSGRVLRKSFAAALLTVLVIALLAACMTIALKKLAVFETVEVGMVIPDEEADEDTMFAVRFLAAIDSVKSVSGFRYYGTAEEALQDMENGKLQAVISLPPYFFEDVDSGVNTPADIYIRKDAGLNTRVFVELLRAGVRMLQVAEAGVYAALDVAYVDRPANESWSEAGNVVAYEYLANGLTRDDVYDSVVLSVIGEMGYGQFYFTAALLIVLLFGGLNYVHLYKKNSDALTQKLYSEGLGEGARSVIRILVMTLWIWIQALVLYLLSYGVSRIISAHLLLWDGFVPAGLLVLAFSMACFFHLVYAIFGGESAGCVGLLAANSVMVLACGLLVPVSYLPNVVQRIAVYLPLYRWDILSLHTFFAESSAGEMAAVVAVSACAAIAGSLIITLRNR
jgi:hypothetical protein